LEKKEKKREFLLNFGGIMAIENIQKDLILPILVFSFPFWLYGERERERESLSLQTKRLVQFFGGSKQN
jgi:hypothetical protein